nr:hypothetical protein [Anaerolineae bacterium]
MAEQLSKLRNSIILVIVLIVGAVLGYIWGLSSVEIADLGLWQLQTGYQALYLQAVADAYQADANDVLAADRMSYLCQEEGRLNEVFDRAVEIYGANPQKDANLDQLRTLYNSGFVVQNADAGVCSFRPIGLGPSIGRLAWLPLLFIIIGLLAYGYLTGQAEPSALARTSAVVAEEKEKEKKPGPPPGQAEVTRPGRPSLPLGLGRKKKEEDTVPRSAASAGAVLSKEAEKTDFEAVGKEPPIVQFMTTYLHGDDLYDDSFSIETSSGEFLGETGVGISEVISSTGEAKSVTALEVWLFDKNDIRTVTKVLMSDHAFNDDAIRAKLAPKGEAAKLATNAKFLLETATLRVQARIVDTAYKTDAMPPNGVIGRVTIELAAWKREAGSSGGAPGLPGSGSTPPSGLPPLPGSGA